MVQAKDMFSKLSLRLSDFKGKYKESIFIIGGFFNDTPGDEMDQWPPKSTLLLGFKPTSFICDHLLLTDAWKFMNPNVKDYTWTNSSRCSHSRIDLWLLSPQGLQLISDVFHSHTPLSDHKMV